MIKRIAIFLVIVLLLAAGGVGYLYMTANVSVAALGVGATEATAQPEVFAALAQQLSEGSVTGTVFRDKPLGKIEDYQFLTYTVRLQNNCFLPADMIELQITPMDGDVMQLYDGTPCTLRARDMGDVQATILTGIDMHAIREITVTYYIWGYPFTLKTAYQSRTGR